MKLLIEIPEEAKQAFDCAESNDIKGSFYDHGGVIGNAIKNGTPIPNETTNWTPVTKATPRDGELVNITWINHNPEPYYEAIKDKPFTATAYYFKNAWYWFSSTTEDYLEEYGDCPWDRIDTDLEITAWMPLPQPYKEDKEENNANDS